MEMMTVEKIGDEITNVVFSGRLDSIGAASVSRHFNAEVSTSGRSSSTFPTSITWPRWRSDFW